MEEPGMFVVGALCTAWTGGDAEVISVKTHRNTIRYNTFLDCNAELTSRGGFRAHVEGNWFFNNRGGIRVFGTGHVIVNKYGESSRQNGIQLPTGSSAESNAETCRPPH